MNTLDVISYCAFGASIIAVPFLLVNWWKYMKVRPVDGLVVAEFPFKSASFFVISVVTAITTASITTTYARRDALNFIHSLSGNYTVYVNQRQVRDSHKIISALKEIAPYSTHHSHPTARIRVDIRCGARDLTLELGRDSSNPREYWVFYPDRGITSDNEIGRITTTAFDEY